jgi:phosphopantetheine adenylyltransferase
MGAHNGFSRAAVAETFDLLSPGHECPLLQRTFHHSPHKVSAQLPIRGPLLIADIGCCTGILTDRTARKRQPKRIHSADP